MLIHLEKLGKSFGEKIVLHDVTASVEREDRIGIVGQNGAGKTTTLQTVSGLLHTRTGSIEFLGQPIQNVPASKLVGRGLAQVPEGRRVFQQMTRALGLDLLTEEKALQLEELCPEK